MASEDQIINSVLAGQTNEFRKLVDRFQQPVYRFARSLLGNDHDAEDMTQEVFLAAFDHLESYNAKKALFLTWLLVIARNRCINHLKAKRPQIDGQAVSRTQSPENHGESERIEFWNHLDSALESLPIEQKTAFVLAEIEGLPYLQIAHIEQTTLGTVKSRIHRARQRLQAVMAPKLGAR